MKKLVSAMLCMAVFLVPSITFAQTPGLDQTTQDIDIAVESLESTNEATLEGALASDSAKTASLSAEEQNKLDQLKKEDVTQPEQPEVKDRYLSLLENRPIERLSLMNIFAFAVQYAVGVGVPANTVILILLLPLLATFISFVRHVVGLPSIGLYVPIALSITFVATGVTVGLLLLVSIVLAAMVARIFLKHVQMMQLPKVALSMFVVSLFIFLTLTFGAKAGILAVRQISIFPVLLLILLSERVVQLQLERSLKETANITFITVLLGLVGFFALSWDPLRDFVLVYPEIVLLLIPANIIIGRYWGLRWTEYYRFSPIRNASK